MVFVDTDKYEAYNANEFFFTFYDPRSDYNYKSDVPKTRADTNVFD